jgi:hypothetical protein
MKEEQGASDVDGRVISVQSMRRTMRVVASFLNAELESFAAAMDNGLAVACICLVDGTEVR